MLLAAPPGLLSARGAEAEPRLYGRQGCGASDPRSGCCRNQPAKDRQYLAGGPEALGVPQPPLETAAAVGSLRVGKPSHFVRSKSQCFLNPWLKNCHTSLGLFHIEVQSNLEKHEDVI